MDSVPQSYSGKCVSLYPDGSVYLQGKYKKGLRNGKFESFYPNGDQLMIGRFSKGVQISDMKTFHENGYLSSLSKPDNDDFLVEMYHENGNLSSKGKMNSEGLFGIWYTYNELGELEDSTNFDAPNDREIYHITEEFPEEEAYDPYEGDEELRAKVDAIYRNEERVGEVSEGEIVDFPDVDAQFSGGMAKMNKFIQSNVYYPEEAKIKGIQGTVYISFIVKSDGSISGISVRKGIEESLDKEAIRMMCIMPDWVPAESNGKKVASRCRLPIRFNLN